MSTCKHGFSWTSSGTALKQPHDFTASTCPYCGTVAMWHNGAWKVGQESVGSYAMERAERFGDALQEILAVLGPKGGSCKQNKCDGCKYEMTEAVEIIKRTFLMADPASTEDA